jgi:hypothetical protein
MPRFRPTVSSLNPIPAPPSDWTVAEVSALVLDVLSPAHFFTGPNLRLDLLATGQEELAWEIFQGRLLDPAHTRLRKAFLAWNVYLVEPAGRSVEPVLSVKFDAVEKRLFVTRGILCHAWEGYQENGNVYSSREIRKWVRELVGVIPLQRFTSAEALHDELICQLFRAVVGTSRLPLTSVEAPLPGYSLGQLAYSYRPGLTADQRALGPLRSHEELIDHAFHAELSWLEKAKLLETLLHSIQEADLDASVNQFVTRWKTLGHSTSEIPALLRILYNEVSLSPYTDLVEKTLAFLQVLQDKSHVSAVERVDLLGHLLRQQGRHLTAYDLVVFHQFGANYPDALLVDAVLKAYLKLVEGALDLFEDGTADSSAERKRKRLRRRALRQGWLLRNRYEGHPVPDAPTSEGENARVLPEPFERVPTEQIQLIHRRRKRLYEADHLSKYLSPQVRTVLCASLNDLKEVAELCELGTALFLDRPLGTGKAPAEPDQTVLLSHEAFSRSLVEKRLSDLIHKMGLLTSEEQEVLQQQLWTTPVQGIPVTTIRPSSRPAVVSLRDALRAGEDFVVLRTTRSSVAAFLTLFDWTGLTRRFSLDFFHPEGCRLILRGMGSSDESAESVTVYDGQVRPRLLLTVETTSGYESRGGCEVPVDGLRILRVWEELAGGGLAERDLRGERVVVFPRSD